MNRTIECVDSCPDSRNKQLSVKVLDVPRFLCIDSSKRINWEFIKFIFYFNDCKF